MTSQILVVRIDYLTVEQNFYAKAIFLEGQKFTKDNVESSDFFSPQLKVSAKRIYRRAHPFNTPRSLLTYLQKLAKEVSNSIVVKDIDKVISYKYKP